MTASIMSATRLIFERQGWHLALLTILIAAVSAIGKGEDYRSGSYWGLVTPVWFCLAVAIPIAHQVYVWACWRLELHAKWLSRHFGESAFPLYAAGFAVFGSARILVLIGVAAANRDTLAVDERWLDAVGTLMLLPVGYLFYSVARYFTFRRAMGIDHFDPSYRNKPLVRKGIFRHTRNGMYTFGLLAAWLPGLYGASKAALLAAAFNHAYIWVHYYCTELPDMRRIYGGESGKSAVSR